MTLQKDMPVVEPVLTELQSETSLADTRGFTLVDFLRIVQVRRNLIIGTAALVVALVTVAVLLMTPLYTATAVVMLDQKKNNLADASAVLSDLPNDQTATIQNQVQILTSLELAGRVVDKLNLKQDPEFNPRLTGIGAVVSFLSPSHWFPTKTKTQADAQGFDLERSQVIHRFLGGVKVTQIGLSTAMKVSYDSKDPQKATLIANAISNAYVEDQLEAKFEATQKATQWLSGRISELAHQAQAADAAVQMYKAEHNITTTANGSSVVDQQIADVNTQLIAARTVLAEKQANYGRLAALARLGRASDSAQVLGSPLIATLRGQQAQLTSELANLSSKYGPRHPKILDLQAQKANLDEKISEEVQRFVDSAKNDADVAASHVYALESSLRQAEAQGAGQNQAQVQLTALQSAATSARSMYEAFLGRFNQAQGQEGIQTPDARIISKAELPQAPSFPKKGLAIGAAVPAGLVLGLLLAFMMERLDSGFRTTTDVENYLRLPVLATLPEVVGSEGQSVNPADLVADRPASSFVEAVRGLRLGLSLSNIDQQPKVILVTSSVPSEGKTTVAVSLARVAARSGLRTVIVDCDLRRPHVESVVGKSDASKGLVDLLVHEASIDECLYKDPRSDALVLPCLHPARNPAEALGSRTMRSVIDRLRSEFDLVVIDSAPVLPVHDARVLGQLVDTMLLVVRWEKTPRDAVANALRAMLDTRVSAAGVALTRADNERFLYYSYGYQNYRSYGKYYSD